MLRNRLAWEKRSKSTQCSENIMEIYASATHKNFRPPILTDLQDIPEINFFWHKLVLNSTNLKEKSVNQNNDTHFDFLATGFHALQGVN